MSWYQINRSVLKSLMKELRKVYRKKMEDLLKIMDVKKPTYYAILRRWIMGQRSFDKFVRHVDMEQILEKP